MKLRRTAEAMETNTNAQLDTSSHEHLEAASELEQQTPRPLSHKLTFPQLRVNDTLASLASSSSSLTMPGPRSRSPSISTDGDSLEDSYVNINDEAVSETDDEEGHTASLTSGGRETPDDLSSIADTDFSQEEEYQTVPHNENAAEADSEDEDSGEELGNVEESSMTATINDTFSMASTLTAKPLDHQFVDDDRFEEEQLENDEELLSQIRGEYTSSTHAEDLERFGKDRVWVTLQQTISFKDPNALNNTEIRRPLTIHVLGAPDTVFDAITNKIMEARAAFKAKSNKAVPLRSVRFERWSRCPSETKSHVDLIILYHHRSNQACRINIQRCLECSRTRAVPTLDIASPDLEVENPKTKALSSYLWTEKSLHTLIVDQLPATDGHVLQVNPVDLSTFLGVPAGLLARHLACIMDEDQQKHPCKAPKRGLRSLVREKWPTTKETSLKLGGGILLTLIPLFIALMISLINSNTRSIWSLSHFNETLQEKEVSPVQDGYSLGASSSIATSISIVTLATAVSAIPSLSTAVPTPRKESYVQKAEKAVGLALPRDFFQPKNESKEFNVTRVGLNRVILTPPAFLAERRKRPKYYIQARRDGQLVDFQRTTRFGPHVIAVYVPETEAYGNLTFDIWTTARPKINQTLIVSFGSKWEQFMNNKKAFLSGKSKALAKSLQPDPNDPLIKRLLELDAKVEGYVTGVMESISITKDLVIGHVQERTRRLSTESGEWANKAVEAAKEFEPPSPRKSKQLKKARKNAKGLAEKIRMKKWTRKANPAPVAEKEPVLKTPSRRRWIGM